MTEKSEAASADWKHSRVGDNTMDFFYDTLCKIKGEVDDDVVKNIVKGRIQVLSGSNFMYVKTGGGIEIYALSENLEILGEPVAALSDSQITEISKFIPSMYYPSIKENAPPELKAAYKALKDGYGTFVPEKNWFVKLYDENKTFLGSLELLRGR